MAKTRFWVKRTAASESLGCSSVAAGKKLTHQLTFVPWNIFYDLTFLVMTAGSNNFVVIFIFERFKESIWKQVSGIKNGSAVRLLFMKAKQTHF
jgi:hypothetical protein